MQTFSNGQIFVSEFIGTAVLLLLGIGVCANTTLKKAFGNGKDWLLISFGWGFAVFAGASIAWKSGAHLNPAVTLAVATTDGIPWSQVPLYFAAEISGAFVGAGLAYLMYKKQFDTHDEPENTGGIFFTGPSVPSHLWNFVSEVIATFVLIYWVLQASPFEIGTGDSSVHFGNSALGYAGVAFVVIAIGASLGGATGYAVNPARDFGPRVMYSLLPIKGKGSSNWGYAWVPFIGPLVGALIGAGVFLLVGGA